MRSSERNRVQDRPFQSFIIRSLKAYHQWPPIKRCPCSTQGTNHSLLRPRIVQFHKPCKKNFNSVTGEGGKSLHYFVQRTTLQTKLLELGYKWLQQPGVFLLTQVAFLIRFDLPSPKSGIALEFSH